MCYGCAGSQVEAPDLPDAVPVSGVVTLDGQPLEHATVTFAPKKTEGSAASVGTTDAAGKFELYVVRPGVDPNNPLKGAIPGEYTVTVSLLVKPDGTPVPAPKIGSNEPPPPPANMGAMESIPQRYSFPGQSQLTATVGPQGGSDFKFDVQSK
jgi:hypothetical protein